MPLYEYACQDCDHAFEALVFDGDRVACPQCRSTKLERLFSVPAVARVTSSAVAMSPCGDPYLPPCGAPGCQRRGQG